MARGPESQFRASVHKHLNTSQVYYEGMAKVYSQGTPDTYYEGRSGALWIEWKFIRKVPVRQISVQSLLSPAQLRWLLRAHRNRVQCGVIVGHSDGGVFVWDPNIWSGKSTLSGTTFHTLSLPRPQLARLITNIVDSGVHSYEAQSSQN